MREDMRHIIINTGRGPKEYYGKRRKNPYKQDDLPDKERMRDNYGWSRLFGDRIKPLARYLLKQVGRKWDDVYSEICQTLDKRSLRGWHMIANHIVKTNPHSWWRRDRDVDGQPLGGFYHEQFTLYIDDNGILQKKARTKRWRNHQHRENPNIHKDGEDTYWKIDGIWYKVWQYEVKVPVYHILSDAWDYRIETRDGKRQLGKKDLKRLGLKNDTAE